MASVVLIIADISGYTRFMTRTKMSLAHAQAIITELLQSILHEIEIPLHVVEIEGDAVFFYGIEVGCPKTPFLGRIRCPVFGP
jgi:hypothetical protein